MMALPDADSLSCVPRALLFIAITVSSHWAARYLPLWMLGTLPGGKVYSPCYSKFLHVPGLKKCLLNEEMNEWVNKSISLIIHYCAHMCSFTD